VALADIGNEANAQPFGPTGYLYGGAKSQETWDEDKIYRCVCDSEWSVGYGDGETQATSWFGPDCSLRHCPGGDDPYTANVDETNCFLFDRNRATWRGPIEVHSGDPILDAQDYDSFADSKTAYLTAWNEWVATQSDSDGDNTAWPNVNTADNDDLAIVEPGNTLMNIGDKGNLCHVDCSNRGICNYHSGRCKCLSGYYGENCGRQDVRARGL
jgi:hypothetical protein